METILNFTPNKMAGLKKPGENRSTQIEIMMQHDKADLSRFFLAGISYKKTDAETRGLFAISQEQYGRILQNANDVLIGGLFIISTCNRTEVYGIAENEDQLVKLICDETRGDEKTFRKLAYIKTGMDAVMHLFQVGGGLDSQILGDYEIVGQLKQAVKFSKENNGMNCFLERLVNGVLQASKEIKNETKLSSGSVSVSFSAVRYIKENVQDYSNKRILLFGTGKIGKNTCKNLVDYLQNTNITLINRTEERAESLAKELQLAFAPLSDLAKEISNADIILVATGADKPTVLKIHFKSGDQKLVIDLSIPYNVDSQVQEFAGIQLINVDEISSIKDDIIKSREAEVPKAQKIIVNHVLAFSEWVQMRQYAPALKALRNLLNNIALIHTRELNNTGTKCPFISAEQQIRQIVNRTAENMRTQNQGGCHQIQAISEFVNQAGF
jgi:glutamyl-tRNA reductase